MINGSVKSTDNRHATLHRGDELWAKLRGALDARLESPLGSSTEWTGHDVYAHFARWQQQSLNAAREHLAGRRPAEPAEDEDTLNNRWHEEDKGLASEAARERCLRTRTELRNLLLGLTDAQWDLWGRRVAADISGEHYEHHLASLGDRRP